MTLTPGDRQTVVVMGLARSGLAAARFLLNLGYTVRVTDIKTGTDLVEPVTMLQEKARKSTGRLELFLGGHPEFILENTTAVILSPGIPISAPFILNAAARGIPVWSEVELAYRHMKGRVIGITGSNGKSTTTALMAHILKQAGRRAFAAGNIGQPLTDFLEEDGPDTIYVTELSSFQLETIDTFCPHISLILNITPDHLDRYPSMDEYAAAKWTLFKNVSSQNFAVLNARDAWLTEKSVGLPCPVYFFDSKPVDVPDHLRGAGIVNGELCIKTGEQSITVMDCLEVSLPGRHNLENTLAAALAAFLQGLSPKEIRAGITSFKGLPHRLEPVAEIRGRRFFNDSKATNVDSTVLALESFDEPVVLILGGKDKGSDFIPLAGAVKKRVRHCILIGAASEIIGNALHGAAPLTRCRDMAEAVRKGFDLSHPGDVVLLSPACASFDMFDDFEHRGEVFRQEVIEVKREMDK